VLEALFTKLDFNDEGIFVHFAKNRPPNPEIPFVGIQPLLIKGLTSDFTYDASIKLLKHIALLPPENELVEVNQSMPHRYLTSLLGLAPWLMANFEKEESNKLALDLAQMFQKAQLDEFSEHFTNYTKVVLLRQGFFPSPQLFSLSFACFCAVCFQGRDRVWKESGLIDSKAILPRKGDLLLLAAC